MPKNKNENIEINVKDLKKLGKAFDKIWVIAEKHGLKSIMKYAYDACLIVDIYLNDQWVTELLEKKNDSK